MRVPVLVLLLITIGAPLAFFSHAHDCVALAQSQAPASSRLWPETAPEIPGIRLVTPRKNLNGATVYRCDYEHVVVGGELMVDRDLMHLYDVLSSGLPFAKKLGFSLSEETLRPGRRAAWIDIPGINAINAGILAMQKMGDPDAPGVTFWTSESPGEEAPVLECAEHWSRREAVLGGGNSGFKHDLIGHGLGYLLCPEEILKASVRKMKILLALKRVRWFSSGRFDARMMGKIEEEFDAVDTSTSALRSGMFDRGLDPAERLLKIKGALSGLVTPLVLTDLRSLLDRHQKPEFDRVLARYRSLEPVTEKRIAELAAELLRKRDGWQGTPGK